MDVLRKWAELPRDCHRYSVHENFGAGASTRVLTRTMRVFYAADRTPHPELNSSLWHANLHGGLTQLGCEVVDFEYDLRPTFQRLHPVRDADFIRINRPRLSAALVEQVRRRHATQPLDALFTYFYSACVTPEAIRAIRALGIKTFNWYCNASFQLDLVAEIAPAYDYCLVPEADRLEDYRALGANPLYCQEAADPTVYKPCDVTAEHDVAFVGQAYGERPEIIRQLVDAGIDVRVWGIGWERYRWSAAQRARLGRWWRTSHVPGLRILRGIARRLLPAATLAHNPRPPPTVTLPGSRLGGPLSDLELVRMFSRARINLGLSACGDTASEGRRVTQIRLRDFEIPLSGGFYLVEYQPELERFFRVGKEIACYTDRADLVRQIRHYLAHPEQRAEIARAGRKRCLAEHTWAARFRAAFAQAGLTIAPVS